MGKVRLNDGDGTWIDDEGVLMTTVWTCSGWMDLPGEYEVNDKFLPVGHPFNDDSLNLTIVIENGDESRFLNVISADFEVVS